MGAQQVVLVQTGTANTASVVAGLRRAGVEPQICNRAREVVQADFLVLPGVGSLAPAMERLNRDGLVDVIRERIEQARPTLAVCLGLQILCQQSEESPGVSGLGIVAGKVERFDDNLIVPQMGWNKVEPDEGCCLLEPGYAYFANSFRLAEVPKGWHGALSDHGGPFVAALERGPVLACQFHPELSGAWGLQLLRRWLGRGGGSC